MFSRSQRLGLVAVLIILILVGLISELFSRMGWQIFPSPLPPESPPFIE